MSLLLFPGHFSSASHFLTPRAASFPRAVATNYHPLGGFEQQKCVLSSSGGQKPKSGCWQGRSLPRGCRGGATLASASAGTRPHPLAPGRTALHVFTPPPSGPEPLKRLPLIPPSFYILVFSLHLPLPSCPSPLGLQVPRLAPTPTTCIIPQLFLNLSLRRASLRSKLTFLLLMSVVSGLITKGSFSFQSNDRGR